VAVIAVAARQQPLNDQVTAIGDGRAWRSVTLVPEVSGVLSAVDVQSGSYIEEGATIAALKNEAEKIALDRARLVRDDAAATSARVKALERSGAVTDIQIKNAELDLRTAELALRQAELDLAKRRIVAPISGWVGILNAEPGDQVTASTALARIDDRSRIVVEFRVPERFVGQIAKGDSLKASPLAQPQTEMEGRISAIDNRVDPDSRTLLVQASLDNVNDRLRAGMAFRISVSFRGESFPSVDPLAIQWGSDGSFVWLVRDGKAMQQPVRILKRNSDAVLVEGELAPGDLVVTEGVQNLRPGAEVEIRPASDEAGLELTPAAFRATKG
ncbi:MAG: efflux RND transporter periplasmic adaptor subunit, partial [Paracoccaceae bacterium]